MIIHTEHQQQFPIRMASLFPKRSGVVNRITQNTKLHLLLVGAGTLHRGNQSHELIAPCAWRCDQGDHLHYTAGKKWQEVTLGLTATWQELGYQQHPRIWRLQAPELIKSLCKDVQSLAVHPHAPGNNEAIAALLRAIISAAFATEINASAHPREYLMNKIAHEWMEQLHRDHSLDQAAETCDLSAVQFRRLWKERFGLPPSAWLTARRMELAQELLIGPQSIHDIAKTLGYADQRYFATVFRKHYGVSPSTWRTRPI